MSIVVENLLKMYGPQKAVNRIGFAVTSAGVTGFLGPNGAGKSTTMKILTGYLQPDGGTAMVGGLDVVKSPMQTKRLIGYLPESNALYYDMYVREYLAFVGKVYQLQNLNAQIENCIGQVGLGPEAGKKIGQLSKGYKQRVGLAAAIIHNPEVLILDEPTSGLDPNQIVEIRALIKALGRDKTVLLSTHIMQEVEAVCDRVIIINKGVLVADSPLETLKKQGAKKSLKVGFEEVLEKEWLMRLADVESVEKLDGQHWLIHGASVEHIRKQVLQLAHQENLNITSLETAGGRLEEIFRNLTTQPAAGS